MTTPEPTASRGVPTVEEVVRALEDYLAGDKTLRRENAIRLAQAVSNLYAPVVAALAKAERERDLRAREVVLSFNLPYGRENDLLNAIADRIAAP